MRGKYSARTSRWLEFEGEGSPQSQKPKTSTPKFLTFWKLFNDEYISKKKRTDCFGRLFVTGGKNTSSISDRIKLIYPHAFLWNQCYEYEMFIWNMTLLFLHFQNFPMMDIIQKRTDCSRKLFVTGKKTSSPSGDTKTTDLSWCISMESMLWEWDVYLEHDSYITKQWSNNVQKMFSIQKTAFHLL